MLVDISLLSSVDSSVAKQQNACLKMLSSVDNTGSVVAYLSLKQKTSIMLSTVDSSVRKAHALMKLLSSVDSTFSVSVHFSSKQ